MIELDFSVCTGCGIDPQGGRYTPDGQFGADAEIPCCAKCVDSGEIEKWTVRAKLELAELSKDVEDPCALSGNVLADLTLLRKFKLVVQQLEDNVCPNGCALLCGTENHRKCPVCGFVYKYTP